MVSTVAAEAASDANVDISSCEFNADYNQLTHFLNVLINWNRCRRRRRSGGVCRGCGRR